MNEPELMMIFFIAFSVVTLIFWKGFAHSRPLERLGGLCLYLMVICLLGAITYDGWRGAEKMAWEVWERERTAAAAEERP